MKSIEQLRKLFEYNDWANRRLISGLQTHQSEAARKLLAHLLITEREYFERLSDKDSTGFNFWQDLNLTECLALQEETNRIFQKLLSQIVEEDLEQIARYHTSEGTACRNSFREMLTHVLFHSATHRGQINMALRADGAQTVSTDYIIYLREMEKR